MKTSDLRYALSKLELLKRITDGSLGAESPAAGGYEGEVPSCWTIFCNSLEKNTIYWHWITFRTCSKKFESTRFLTFQSQLKNLIVQSSFYLQFKSKTRLKSCILV